MQIKKPKCLRCEKADAYTKKGFTSAWCPQCHWEKFGCTHEQRNAPTLPKSLPIVTIK